MKIYKSIEEFNFSGNSAVTIGTFDGVHIGHQKIISNLQKAAKEIQGESVVLTFFPHPRLIINPDDEGLKLISDIQEKTHQLYKARVDHLIITPFTRDFSNQTPEEYINGVLVRKLRTKKIVIGYDHHFGKDRKGTIKDLRELSTIYDFEVQEIPKQDIDDVSISSTRIREALIKGDVETANKYLGYPFQLTGKVTVGDQVGRTIGFPTANLSIAESHKLIPAYGIYAVQVEVIDNLANDVSSGPYQEPEPILKADALAYIGTRPTLDGLNRTIEVHLLDFQGDLYKKTIKVHFLHFIRHDQRFEGMDAMIQQMKKDEAQVREFFKNYNQEN
ncbi:MAG TPA: bifunctional riboflavin kinase/FAD synthetase [Candidatus Sphingobacterium stercoripullorum]|nr:bifunctional riboflavin kinase/FAD synthetase [Candidatus Sphingobacterium stercoripullorum]